MIYKCFLFVFPDALRASVKYTLFFCKFANFKIMFAAKLLHCKFFSQKAVTTWNFIIGGTMKSYGLLYVEFITLFSVHPDEGWSHRFSVRHRGHVDM